MQLPARALPAYTRCRNTSSRGLSGIRYTTWSTDACAQSWIPVLGCSNTRYRCLQKHRVLQHHPDIVKNIVHSSPGSHCQANRKETTFLATSLVH